MKDTEIRDLIQDLESVGLSDDPSVIVSGQDGVVSIYGNIVSIQMSSDTPLESIYLLKRASYQRVEVEETFCWLVFENYSYFIQCKTNGDAKRVAKKIQTFLNS